jgi:hypothetical protein
MSILTVLQIVDPKSKLHLMSASELLKEVSEEVRKLPPSEQKQFFDALIALKGSVTQRAQPVEPPSACPPDIQARHRRIFGDTILSENIVLAERADSQS